MFTHSGHIMTLANSIIGVGILAMPFCFQKCGIILSIVLLVLSNWVTRICCHYLIKISLLTRRKSFELLGLHAFGASGKLLAELCIIGYLIGTCITYFVVVGDLGPQIIAKMFGLNITEQKHLRIIVMLVVTVLCIAPLGMLRNVDSLSALCTASIGFYVCLMLKIVLESETHIVANDWMEKVLYWEPAGVLQCLPIFSMALSCQMQLFEVFESINNQSLEKLNGIVRNATWICTLVYIAVGFFGYVAYCTHTFSGNILVNLSPSFGSDIMKIGFVLSIAFSFPLVIFPCRASIYSLLYRKGHTDTGNYIPEQRFRAITLFIVGFSFCVALVIPSVELIIGLVGSTIGVAICIMFPASSFRKIVKKESNERKFAQFVFVSGFCLMVLGTFANLNAIDEKSSGLQFDMMELITPLSPNEMSPDLDPQLTESKLSKPLLNEPFPEPNKDPNSKLKLKHDRPQMNVESEKIVPISDNSPLPPLPVDEQHAGIIKDKSPMGSPQDVSGTPLKAIESAQAHLAEKKNLTTENVAAPPNDKAPLIHEKTQMLNTPAQQTIAGAAIKKEDEVAAEEQKESKANADELRKTQNELKKTKELLERTVDELKEELAKQNEETKNLVVEKLGEVVEKVEQIERKVKQDEELPKAIDTVQLQLDSAPNHKQEEPKPKGSLINLLAENAHMRDEQEAHAGVFEPLSYKTGELLKNTSSNIVPELVQRLPLPLALQRNATEIIAKDPLIRQPTAQISHKTNDLENVEAIRRELLNLKKNKKANTEQPLGRIKREADENCLPEPKLNIVDGSAAISLQIENIGRDLKSVKEEEESTVSPEAKLIKN